MLIELNASQTYFCSNFIRKLSGSPVQCLNKSFHFKLSPRSLSKTPILWMFIFFTKAFNRKRCRSTPRL